MTDLERDMRVEALKIASSLCQSGNIGLDMILSEAGKYFKFLQDGDTRND
jgi:hypothetical protein